MSTTRSPSSSGSAAASAGAPVGGERADPVQPRFGREAVVGDAVVGPRRTPQRALAISTRRRALRRQLAAAAGGRRGRRCRPRPPAPPGPSAAPRRPRSRPPGPWRCRAASAPARSHRASRSSASSRRPPRSPARRRRRATSRSTGAPAAGAVLPSEGGSRISIAAAAFVARRAQATARAGSDLAAGDRLAAGVDLGLGRLDRSRAAVVALGADRDRADRGAEQRDRGGDRHRVAERVDELLRRGGLEAGADRGPGRSRR